MNDSEKKAVEQLEQWGVAELNALLKRFDQKGKELGVSDKRRPLSLVWSLFGFAGNVAKQVNFPKDDAVALVKRSYE